MMRRISFKSISLSRSNKKILFRTIFASVLFAAVSMTGYLVHFLWRSIPSFGPASISVTCKHVYSDEVKKDIEQFVKHYLATCDYAKLDLEDFFKNLKYRFKVVKKVYWNWGSLDGAELIVEGVKPAFRVNKELVFGNKKRLFPYSLFASVTGDVLPSVSIEPVNFLMGDSAVCGTWSGVGACKLPGEVYEFIKNVPQKCLNGYTFSYSGRNKIFLQKDFGDFGLRFVFDRSTLDGMKDEAFVEKMDLVALVHKDFLDRKGAIWRRRKNYEYDLRFKDRIYAKVIRKKMPAYTAGVAF